jgi:hypothetical protein
MPASGAIRKRSAAPALRAWVGAAVLLLAAVFVLYARALGRGFTSEDFLLVRWLGEHPPWLDLRAQLAEPWLGMRGIEFFRPVSTLLYGAEIAAFGADPRGYVMVHLVAHGLAALLLFGVTRELVRRDPATAGPPAAPWLAAVLFAVYPLHPNAVVFTASFATLSGGILALLALYGYQRSRAGGGRGWWVGSFAAFCLALGCYEATAVVPLWLAAHDQLFASRQASRRRLVAGSLPFFALLAAYFGWRRHLFGDLVGGYAATRDRLGDPFTLAADLVASLGRLHLPFFAQPAARATAVLGLLAVLAAVAFLRPDERARAAARGWVFGAVVAISAMAPFAFRPVVPANGRYWYLAAAGAAIGLAFLAAGLAAAAGARRLLRRLPWALASLVAVAWAAELVRIVDAHRRAADLAHTIQQEILRVRPAAPAAGLPLFVTGHPDFLTRPPGLNVAQVFHYGLRDSVGPPFVGRGVDVYPLPPLSDGELGPVAAAAFGRVLVWDAAVSRLRPPGLPPPPASLGDLALVGAAGEAGPAGAQAVAVRVPPGPHERFRLLLSTPINGMVVDLGAAHPTHGVLRAPLPEELLAIAARLYGNRDVFLWIEARDGRGNLTGQTRLHRLALRLAPRGDQPRSLSPIM